MSSRSFYAGPGRDRLLLRTWGDVEVAAGAGLLAESAWIELKEAVPATSKAANRELAKDLASLSVDGGLLVVGVTDAEHDVVGCPGDPSALRTRVTQVAAAISPPLFVDVDIFTKEDGGRVLHLAVVRVPASGSAPHMVDGQYWGRTAEGKRPLPDPEVTRLMAERRLRPRHLERDLRGVEEDLGPLGDGLPRHAHLIFVAAPTGAAGTTVTDALQEDFPPQVVNQAADFSPAWGSWSSLGRNFAFHPDGILLSSDDLRFGQRSEEEYAFRILLRNDGAVLGVGGGASHTMTHERIDGEFESIVCGYLLEGVHVLSRLAGYLATERLGYWADWDVGLLVSGIHGLYATDRYYDGSLEHHAFPRPEYHRQTHATTRELLEQPAAVTQRLLLPMLRTLGVSDRWLPYERGEDIAQRRR